MTYVLDAAFCDSSRVFEGDDQFSDVRRRLELNLLLLLDVLLSVKDILLTSRCERYLM